MLSKRHRHPPNVGPEVMVYHLVLITKWNRVHYCTTKMTFSQAVRRNNILKEKGMEERWTNCF